MCTARLLPLNAALHKTSRNIQTPNFSGVYRPWQFVSWTRWNLTVGVGLHPTSYRHDLHLHRNACSTSATPFSLPMPEMWGGLPHWVLVHEPREGLEHSDADYEHEHTDPGCSVESGEDTLALDTDARDACQQDEGTVKHFAGDIDRPGLLQCANWSAKELSPQQKETFRFLQVVDAGDGTSGRVAQGVPNYARRLGGDGLLLPRTTKRCWQMLDQVQCFIKLLNSQFKF